MYAILSLFLYLMYTILYEFMYRLYVNSYKYPSYHPRRPMAVSHRCSWWLGCTFLVGITLDATGNVRSPIVSVRLLGSLFVLSGRTYAHAR